ncbi:cytoplasmic protein [Dacryopinax primogenitus]|uniref:Cytoplasmic protein n=1 Tax=Dacryopinax primogenitus (strain DJM 731) TaxID=1858805 RepID=M5G422_DACPD|nr:cytoplasmic protein [Dacryopinax primogenitus]EJU02960.1 cytoplasmic protein [Dacryopinax primogenitus]
MVLFFTSTAVNPPATIYMGKDKVENEDLIKYGTPQDVWFHVDKLSSAHVYLRLGEGMSWEEIPEALLKDCAQLVKANSIQGNKLNDQTIIYTPWDNIKKSGDMAVGQVSFHQPKRVKRVHVAARENAIVNRLNKTKVEREVDHEAERQARLRVEGQARKAAAQEKKKQEAELAKTRAEEKQAKSYDTLFTEEAGYGVDKEGYDPEEDFM